MVPINSYQTLQVIELSERVLQASICNHSAENLWNAGKFHQQTVYEEHVLLNAEKVGPWRVNHYCFIFYEKNNSIAILISHYIRRHVKSNPSGLIVTQFNTAQVLSAIL